MFTLKSVALMAGALLASVTVTAATANALPKDMKPGVAAVITLFAWIGVSTVASISIRKPLSDEFIKAIKEDAWNDSLYERFGESYAEGFDLHYNHIIGRG